MKLEELIKEFNSFIKSNSADFEVLEQANFIQTNSLDLKKISNDLVSNQLNSLYESIKIIDLDVILERIKKSYFDFANKKNMLLLLLASKGDKYYHTLNINLSEVERKFIITYLYKLDCFIKYISNNKNNGDLALFLYDINAFRKYLKSDEFLMPIKLNNAFNWIKKTDLSDEVLKKNLEKSIKHLFKSRRKYYKQTEILPDLVKKYENYEAKFNTFLN